MKDKIKSGFVTICGRPNVGKSTLLNSLIGEKVAIVSHRPQTTRNSIRAVLNTDSAQIVFIDTPGLIRPRNKLNEYMVKSVDSALKDTDIVLLMVDGTEKISGTEKELIERFNKKKQNVILVINKTDIANKGKLANLILQYSELSEFKAVVPVSALKKDGIDILKKEIDKLLDYGPVYFPDNMITDQPDKQIVSEIVREKALKSLNDEVPHGIAVEIEEFKERDNADILDISVIIYCEKDTHKGIVIGKNGSMLKIIATRAREDMENFFGCKVNLRCWVKVKSDWRNDGSVLKNFGYEL